MPAADRPLMRIPFADLAAEHHSIAPALAQAFERVRSGSQFILGDELEAFERAFAAVCGVRHCVGVGNGLDALRLILEGLGIGAGDRVLVPTNTFIATWLAVSACGAVPVPVEPDPVMFNIDPRKAEAAIGPGVRAIIAVHLYGQPADLRALAAIAERHRLALIEDAAQAHGARCAGVPVGGLGAAAAFSFYPTKNLGALGDGGAITTNDEALAARLRQLRNYGSARKYEHAVRGCNSRLDPLQAAFLGAKLPYLERWNARRAEIAARYAEGLAGTGWQLPRVPDWAAPVWHQFVVRCRDRDAVQAKLAAAGVETMIHYPLPVHLQPAYADLGYARGAFPESEAAHDELLSLPIHAQLDDAQIAAVIDACQRSAAAAPGRRGA